MSAGFPAASGLFPNFSNNPSSVLGPTNPYFLAAAGGGSSSSYPPQVNSSFLSDRPRIKLKRTRQRVDAGEPRNTYNSIPSYTPGRVGGQPTGTGAPCAPLPPVPFGGQMSAAGGFVIQSPFSGNNNNNSQQKPTTTPSPDTSSTNNNNNNHNNNNNNNLSSVEAQQQQQNYFRAAYENIYGSSYSNYWANPYVQTFLRMQQQQQQQQRQNDLPTPNNNTSSGNSKTKAGSEEKRKKTPEVKEDWEKKPEENGTDDPKDQEEDQEEEEDEGEEDDTPVRQKKARVENIINTIQPSPSALSDVSPKRREEPAVNTTECPSPEEGSGGRVSSFNSDGTPKSKRKQYQPQQVDSIPDDEAELLEREMTDFEEDGNEEDDFGDADESMNGEEEPTDNKIQLVSPDDTSAPRRPQVKENAEGNMKTEIKRMQSEIFVMQQRYMEMFAAQQKRYMYGMTGAPVPPPHPPPQPPQPSNGQPGAADQTSVKNDTNENSSKNNGKDLKNLAQNLKNELISCMNATVDKIITQYLQAEAERLAALATQRQASAPAEARAPGQGTTGVGDQRQGQLQHQLQQQQQQQFARPPFYFPPFYYNPSALAAAPFGSNFNFSSPNAMTNGQSTIFPQYGNGNPYFNNLNAVGAGGLTSSSSSLPATANSAATANGNGKTPLSLDDSNLPFGLARKKRSKVTDTRVSKLPLRQDESTAASSPAGFGYPTMVPHQMFQNHSYGSLDDSDVGAASPDGSDGTGSEMAPYDPNMPQSTTLTPMHLRKAKLMFFYTRYPSSALLKAFFPDIRFNKNNTAQLVKWFSNFREFYYIQMEKYARQALAEGVRAAEEIQVSVDSELYKVLNLHYNRNNHIQVPTNFRRVVEATLREFFLAIQATRDAEPSWKKAIYKVIARMDEPIPEYFKTPNFLEQLE